MKVFLLAAALACLAAAQPKAALQIVVTPTAALKAGIEVPFRVTIKAAKGTVVTGAAVAAVATMVDMDHGQFKYEARESKPGVYELRAKFLMGGAWNLAVTAKKGAESATVNRKIEVKD